MSTRPFSFVHASDLHLERPITGLAEVPEHLRELFLEAPYKAAEKVFDAVLAENADFLVLYPGDVLDPQQTGPRGPLFLVEQFTRLAERGIGVYWAGGQVDPPQAWPAGLALPGNVHVFPHGRVQEATAEREGQPLARLLGVARDAYHALRPGDFSPDAAGAYTIAVAHAEVEPSALGPRGVDCWALGGRHERSKPLGEPHVIHYCGSPQGRTPLEPGMHGCTLVQVDGQRRTRTSLIPTDVVRWQSERMVFAQPIARADLQSQLQQRMQTLVDAAGSTALLISWTIAGAARESDGANRDGPSLVDTKIATVPAELAAELLAWLRNDYGYRLPAAWSVSLQSELPETFPAEWYEQETIRGDFLRAVRHLQMNPDQSLGLESCLSEAHLAGTLGEAAALSEKSARDSVLREAAALAVDLLTGEEPRT